MRASNWARGLAEWVRLIPVNNPHQAPLNEQSNLWRNLMQEQPELNFNKAETAKNVGMMMTESGSKDDVQLGWSTMAFFKLKEFLKYYPKNTFLTERIRVWCYKNGLHRPSNEKAWGSIVVRAQRDGLIKFAGYEKTTNPLAHRTPAALWSKS